MPHVLHGRYEVGARLGSGGMADIYEAQDLRLGRRVAIKFLRTDVPDARTRERFQREARAAARFNHPNAVTIYDVGADGSRPYLVMELVDGGSVAQLLVERGCLNSNDAVAIIDQILGALVAAHAEGTRWAWFSTRCSRALLPSRVTPLTG